MRVSAVGCALALVACGSPAAQLEAPVGPRKDYGHLLFPRASAVTGASSAPPPKELVSAELLRETGPATWRADSDADGPFWVRSHGARAADLVIRGTTSPSKPDYMGQYFAPGARLATSIRLKTEGPVPALRVWAKASGPLGILVDGYEPDAREDGALSIDLTHHTVQLPGGSSEVRPAVEGEVLIRIADIDRPNERRGQTSPYVIVVTEDLASPRVESPLARPPLPKDALAVRWDMRPVDCGRSEFASHCYRAAVIVGGTRFSLPGTLDGQSDCLPEDAGVVCEGASGGTIYDFRVAPSGRVALMSHFHSDGACYVEGTDCGTHSTVLSFGIPAGKRLVADPAGTFPPLPASALKP